MDLEVPYPIITVDLEIGVTTLYGHFEAISYAKYPRLAIGRRLSVRNTLCVQRGRCFAAPTGPRPHRLPQQRRGLRRGLDAAC